MGKTMLAPDTRITEIFDAVTEIIEGRAQHLIWGGTPVEPEDWKFSIIIASDDPSREVYEVRHDDGRQLGVVNKIMMLHLMELARVRLEREREELEQQFAQLEQQEKRLQVVLPLRGIKKFLADLTELLDLRDLRDNIQIRLALLSDILDTEKSPQ